MNFEGSIASRRQSLDWADLVEGIRAGEEQAVFQFGSIFQDGIRFFLLRGLGMHQLQSRQREVLTLVIESIRDTSGGNPNRLASHVFTVLHQYINAQTGVHPHLVLDNESRANTDDVEAIEALLAKVAAVDKETLRRYDGDGEMKEPIARLWTLPLPDSMVVGEAPPKETR